jgi:O-antigen/teichoic acid export membrane protein
MGTAAILAVTERPAAERLSFAAVGRDVATLGSGTLLATAFNILLIFLIPRLVNVEDYGYWRLFLLYSGYAGFLHLGLVDGALLRWAGRTLGNFHHEILPSMKFLLWQHVVTILLGAVGLSLFLGPEHRFVGIAVLLFSLLINLTTLLQFALQSARMFGAVAVSTASPLGMFLIFVFLWELKLVPDFRTLILFYFLASAIALAYLFVRMRKYFASDLDGSAWDLGKSHILLGWPVLLANTGLGLVQSADKLVVSWQAPIHDFALYSLAASSTMTMVLAIAVAAYRVFFPHLAALGREQHARVYATASRWLFLCWTLLLPYCFVLEAFVRRVLPRYTASLPIAYLLLVGTVFLGSILILHTSFAYLYGRQRAFLSYTLGALGMSLLVAMGAAYGTHSLRVVAAGEVVTLGLWWMVDEWQLRDITGQTLTRWGPVLGLFGWAALSYWLAFHEAHGLLARMCAYYGLVAGVLWLVCRAELRLGVRFLQACGEILILKSSA